MLQKRRVQLRCKLTRPLPCSALTLAAQDGLLNEGFFFIPSLGGPATIEQQLAGQGLNWLVPFVDGVPPLGWETTAKYLALPILLVASQYASMSISQPANSDDPSVKQTQAILRYLPIMIGACHCRTACAAGMH
jgi:YidC/Oxa1 family membrane protein insertase